MGVWSVTRDGGTPAYRRRRPLPAIATLVVLAVAMAVVWVTVVHQSDSNAAALDCNAPTNPPAGRQVLARDALDKTTPLPVDQVQVHVVNGGSQRGLAGLVTLRLQQLGFSQTAPPSNDSQYTSTELRCRGQIRFGPNGASAARTLSLIEPCSQLVRDNRQDATVDMALGSKFIDLHPNTDAKKVLAQLAAWAKAQPQQHGGQQSQDGGGAPLDPKLLAGARNVSCS
ncbi:MAG: envelope integrity protein Cei [Sciscionella sp.]